MTHDVDQQLTLFLIIFKGWLINLITQKLHHQQINSLSHKLNHHSSIPYMVTFPLILHCNNGTLKNQHVIMTIIQLDLNLSSMHHVSTQIFTINLNSSTSQPFHLSTNTINSPPTTHQPNINHTSTHQLTNFSTRSKWPSIDAPRSCCSNLSFWACSVAVMETD